MPWRAIGPQDEKLEPLSIDQILGPVEVIKETSAAREWGIRKVQERFGLDREGAEKIVDQGST